MIKTLRRKFIIIAMIAVTLVLAVVILGINISTYHKMNDSLNMRMDMLFMHFPYDMQSPDNKQGPGDMQDPDNVNVPENVQDAGIPAEPFRDKETRFGEYGKGISKETLFETRYFTVFISHETKECNVNIDKIVSVSEEEAEESALSLYEDNKRSGFIGKFKYRAKTQTDSQLGEGTLYIFMDSERELGTMKNYIISSILISIAGLVVVFVLVYFFSGIVFKPIIEGYNKQKQFITDASHELKTPLSIISANNEVLEMKMGENEWTKSTANQVKRLAKLTENLVLLSRMEEEEAKPEFVSFSLTDAVSETVSEFEGRIKAKQITFTKDIDDKLNLVGDEGNIRQLISILMDNAVKYTPVHGEIELKCYKEKKSICISLFNTAKDIQTGKLDMLFERFYRADKSRNSDVKGYGIGLSVAKAIVTRHKGKISAYSEDGRSVCFEVVL